MRLIAIILGLIVVCTACIPAISATYQRYYGPEGQGWVVEQNLTPMIDPNTGLPYTSYADYTKNTDPESWNNMTPENKAILEAMPAMTGYTTIKSPAFNLTDEQFARVMKENMTDGETYAWLYPDFWAAVVAVGADKTIDWNQPMIMYDTIPPAGPVAPPKDPGITVADGNTTRTIPADSPEAKSLLNDQQIRFLTGKIPFDSPEMKSILGEQQWNTLNGIQQYQKSIRITSTNVPGASGNVITNLTSGMNSIAQHAPAFQSVSGINNNTPNIPAFQPVSGTNNIQGFQSVSGNTEGIGTLSSVKDSNPGSSAGLIRKLGHTSV